MSLYIVDASVAAKWFLEEELSQAALAVLNKNHQLHAPDFLLLEMDSIICKWIRRGTVTVPEGSDLREAFRRCPISHHPYLSLLDSAFAVAVQTGQSIYDSLYVALAVLLNGRMVTADRRLYDSLKTGSYRKRVMWVGDIK